MPDDRVRGQAAQPCLQGRAARRHELRVRHLHAAPQHTVNGSLYGQPGYRPCGDYRSEESLAAVSKVTAPMRRLMYAVMAQQRKQELGCCWTDAHDATVMLYL